ncbi:hypothetical protein GEMRC1_000968 [Eukaryota sp. GEM-RC1]
MDLIDLKPVNFDSLLKFDVFSNYPRICDMFTLIVLRNEKVSPQIADFLFSFLVSNFNDIFSFNCFSTSKVSFFYSHTMLLLSVLYSCFNRSSSEFFKFLSIILVNLREPLIEFISGESFLTLCSHSPQSAEISIKILILSAHFSTRFLSSDLLACLPSVLNDYPVLLPKISKFIVMLLKQSGAISKSSNLIFNKLFSCWINSSFSKLENIQIFRNFSSILDTNYGDLISTSVLNSFKDVLSKFNAFDTQSDILDLLFGLLLNILHNFNNSKCDLSLFADVLLIILETGITYFNSLLNSDLTGFSLSIPVGILSEICTLYHCSFSIDITGLIAENFDVSLCYLF